MYKIRFSTFDYVTDDQAVVIEHLKYGFSVRKIKFLQQSWGDGVPCKLVQIGGVFLVSPVAD